MAMIIIVMQIREPNKFKAFYHLNRSRKTLNFNSMDYKHLQEPFLQLLMGTKNTSDSYEDSFDQMLRIPQSQKEILHPQNNSPPPDTPDIKASHHTRSQSCPYITPNFNQNIKNLQQSPPLIQKQPRLSLNKDLNSPQSRKIRKLNTLILPFAKRSQPRNSMLSQSSQSVVIHNNLACSLTNQSPTPLSYMLYSQKKNQGQPKKTIAKVSRKLFQNTNQECWRKSKYLKIKLQQQIKKYQLNSDLKKLQKETTDINIKQNVLEGILRKAQIDNKYLGYDTNQSFIIQEGVS